MFDLFLTQTKILENLGGMWIVTLLVFCRVLAFASTAPLIGHKSVSSLVRIGFSILLTLIIFPNIEAVTEYPQGIKFIYLIVMNVFVGLLIGWMSNLVLEVGRAGGEVLDMQMGLNAATIFDPSSQTQSTIIGRFFDFLALALFVSVGGMEKIIEGIYKSYNIFPIIIYEINLTFDKVLRATSDVIIIGFLIVSPIVIIILVVDLILGIMSRAAPQINAFQISFSIKPSLGMVLLLVLLPTMLQILTKLFSAPHRFF